MSLGERIKHVRLKKDMKQEELGKLLNVGKSTISQYETNKSTPDAATISKIADIFNTTTDYLLGRTDNPNSTTAAKESKAEYPIAFSSQGDINIKELEKVINRAVKKALKEREKERDKKDGDNS